MPLRKPRYTGVLLKSIYLDNSQEPFTERGEAAMSNHGELTLACRTVMRVAREVAKSGMAGLSRVAI